MKINEELMGVYAKMFQAGGEPVLKAICNCAVPSSVVLAEYRKLSPIENLPEAEKAELKAYVIEMFPGETVVFLMNAAKIIYTVGTLI